jgi:molybdate transport system substrate-binding protein
VGRVVLWTRSDSGIDVSKGLTALLDPRVTRVAIANPAHAPYGQRAKESLQHAGLWERIQPKLVLGENISQSAQFVQTGNAQAGIVSLSLALAPAMKDGRYLLLDPSTHKPLEQGYVLLKRAGGNGEARRFAAFLETKEAREILKGYGFGVPAM